VITLIQKDGALYFDRSCRSLARKTMILINRTFHSHLDMILMESAASLLEYHIKPLLGPCVKGCVRGEYQEAVRDVRLLLEAATTTGGHVGRAHDAASKRCAMMAAKYRDCAGQSSTVRATEMATSPERDVTIFGYYREGCGSLCSCSRCAKATSSAGANSFGRLAADEFDPASF